MTDIPNPNRPRPFPGSSIDETQDTVAPEQLTVEFSSLDPYATDVTFINIDPNATLDPSSTIDPHGTIEVRPQADANESFDPYDTEDGVIASEQPPLNDAAAQRPASGISTLLPESVLILPPTPELSTDVASSLDQTVAFSDIDQTIELTPIENGGRSASTDDASQKTKPASQFDRTVEIDDFVTDGNQTKISQGTTSVDIPAPVPSVMYDTCVTQTINPRELSAEDAAHWGDLSRGAAQSEQPSRLSPAINRSLSETKLHLRGQVVASAQSEIASQSDYRLVRLLGKGGMGNVYVARQGSLDRLVALKVIKPLEEEKRKRFEQRGTLEQVEQERRLQFISEAVVTGDLDHPNIVPIHDIAVTGDNTLFYSMKRVSGTPWSKVIDDKSRDENIDILLKVCDAIGLAHTRGVVHRDIKPENIMLGEFGVVMVMDWGLALAKPEFEKLDSIHHSTGLGGSPAYMAPEMATGPIDRIGPASDIYLLGATLFQIVTGQAPHYATNVSECLKAVASNQIREVPKEHHGELLQIALKAMATRPEDRYENVAAFQTAIRNYRSHSESIALTTGAHEEVERAEQTGNYALYARAMFGFEEAIKLWRGNTQAIQGSASTRLQYAEAAYRKGDFDLGLSLLERTDESHHPLIEKLERGKKDRAAKVTRLALLRKVAAAMLAFIIIGGGTAMYLIVQESNEAKKQRQLAQNSEVIAKSNEAKAIEKEKLAEEAKVQSEISRAFAEVKRIEAEESAQQAVAAQAEEMKAKAKEIEKRAEAEEQRRIAQEQKKVAEQQTAKAIHEEQIASYENYVSQIGLANARIEQNEFKEATRILTELRDKATDKIPGWEWRWLWRQTTQAISSLATVSPAKLIDLSGPANSVAVVLDNGSVQFANVEQAGRLSPVDDAQRLIDGDATSLTFAPDHQSIFVGTRSGDIEIWNRELSAKVASWTAHQTTINKLRFIDDHILVSASDDKTVRIWDTSTHKELTACWNLGPVKDFAIMQTGKEWKLIAAVAESTSGRATVWSIDRTPSSWQSKLVGEFLEHARPVISVALSPDGNTAVSGDADGRVFVWHVADVQVTDYANDIEGAIKKLSRGDGKSTANEKPTVKPNNGRVRRLIDPELAKEVNSTELAHSDRVRVVRFSPDGKTILTGGDDYAIRLWDEPSAQRIKTFLGHGGWILDANFSGPTGDLVISTSADSTFRSWQPTTYVSAAVANRRTGNDQQPLHDEEILAARLNATGDAVVTASRDRTASVSRINPLTMMIERVAEFRDDADPIALQEGTTFIAQSLALDAEHSLLYIASADAVVRVWDFAKGTERFQIRDTGLNTSLALSRDGRYLLSRSSSPDAKSILWRVDPTGTNSPRLAFKLAGHPKDLAVTALAVSADGSKLFTGDSSGNGIFWDGKTGQQVGPRFETLNGYRLNAAEFIADGNELLIASDDQQLTRVDVQTRAIVSRFNHNGFVTSLSISKDDRFAMTISEQTTVAELKTVATLWNLETGNNQLLDRAVSTITGKVQQDDLRGRITSAQFGPDGRSVAIGKQTSADATGRVVIWTIADSDDAKPVVGFEMPALLGVPQACLPLPNNRMLTLNGDAAFQWKLMDGTSSDKVQKTASLVTSYRANAAVHHANFSADGKFVITGSQSIKIWDIAKQKSIAKIELPHSGRLQCVEFTPKQGSHQFATCGDDGVVKLCDFDPRTLATTVLKTWFESAGLPAVRCVRFSADGSMLLAVGDNGTAKLMYLDGDRATVDYDTTDAGNLTSAAFSSDGRYLIVGGDDAKARLWEVVKPGMKVSGTPIIFAGHADRIEDVKFLSSAAGPLRILTASRDKSARVWDPRIGSEDKLGREVLNLRQHTQGVTAVDATDNGNVVITAGRDATLIVWPASDL